MAQSNGVQGGWKEKAIYCFPFVGVRAWKCSVLISCLAPLLPRCSLPLICFVFPVLAVIFSFVVVCVFVLSLSPRSCLTFLPLTSRLSLSFLSFHGFVICHSVSVHLRPLPIIILHLIYFSSLPPQLSASVILPLHPRASFSAYAWFLRSLR